jgi:hypothetical protein
MGASGGVQEVPEDGVQDEASQNRQKRRNAANVTQSTASNGAGPQFTSFTGTKACFTGTSVQILTQLMAQMGKCLDPRMLKQVTAYCPLSPHHPAQS